MIFISYRRKGGIEFASQLKQSLDEKYDVFFDIDSMRNGKFNEQLYDHIERADDIIVICSPDCFNAKHTKTDWMHLEIKRALDLKKNIILVTLPGFEFPEELDPEISEIVYYQAVNASYEYYQAFLKKLENYLESTPKTNIEKKSAPKKSYGFIAAAVVLLLAGVSFIFINNNKLPLDNQNLSGSKKTAVVSGADSKTDTKNVGYGNNGTTMTTDLEEIDDTTGTYTTYKSNNLNGIPIYENPSDVSPINTIPEARPCKVNQYMDYDNMRWALIDYCGITGWTERKFLRRVSSEKRYFFLDGSDGKTVYVDKESIKLHEKPDEDSGITFSDVKYGTELNVTELENGWGKVFYKGGINYVDMKTVNHYASKYCQVEICNGKSDTISLRKAKGEASESIDKIKAGTVLLITKFDNGWGKTTINGEKGWVKLHYTTFCGPNGLSFSEDTNYN